MGLARTLGVALVGVEGHLVEVETDLGVGVPSYTLVGLPDASLAGEPITTYASTHPAAEAYRQLARELISRGGVA